jgi:hypothetical protein
MWVGCGLTVGVGVPENRGEVLCCLGRLKTGSVQCAAQRKRSRKICSSSRTVDIGVWGRYDVCEAICRLINGCVEVWRRGRVKKRRSGVQADLDRHGVFPALQFARCSWYAQPSFPPRLLVRTLCTRSSPLQLWRKLCGWGVSRTAMRPAIGMPKSLFMSHTPARQAHYYTIFVNPHQTSARTWYHELGCKCQVILLN